MKQRSLLKPYRSSTTASVPANLRDAEDTWVADRLTQCVIQYNTKEFGSAPPASWEELTAPRFKGRLVFFSSANGDGAPRLYTLAKYFGWDLLKRLADNRPLRVQTPQLATQVLESGERGCAFATNDNIAWRSKLQGKATDYVFPTIGVPTEPGGVGLIAKSARPEAAALFYDWWMGETGQKLLVEGGKYSSRTDLAPPKGNPPLASLKLLTIDYGEYQKDRPEVLQRMTDIFGGEWGA
jgi:iron(III) transport system substrate-binding protein